MIMITISEKIMKRSEIWDKCLHSSNQTNGQILCFIESFFFLCIHLLFGDKCTMATASDKSELCFHR